MEKDPFCASGVQGLLKAEGEVGRLKNSLVLQARCLAQDNSRLPLVEFEVWGAQKKSLT